MKFEFQRVSEYFNDPTVIEIATLEELLTLCRKEGHDLIIQCHTPKDTIEEYRTIRVYDDYIE